VNGQKAVLNDAAFAKATARQGGVTEGQNKESKLSHMKKQNQLIKPLLLAVFKAR